MSDDHIATTTRYISRYLSSEESIPEEHLQHISSCASCGAIAQRATELSAMLDSTLQNGTREAEELAPTDTPSSRELSAAAASEVIVAHRRRRAWRIGTAAAVVIIAVLTSVAAASMPQLRHRTAVWWMMMILFAGPIVLAFMTAGLESVSASRLYKQLRGRELSGVCRGLASASGIPVWFVRMIFVSLVFLKGIGLIAYLLLDVLLPIHPDERAQLLRFRLMRWWERRRQSASV
jgi:phage shock protein PspC (stress-responsive transcriptional regulator)